MDPDGARESTKETENQDTENKNMNETAEKNQEQVVSDADRGDQRKKRRDANLGEAVVCRPLEVVVRDERVEQAIRQLKNRMAREGVLRELKNRRHYFKPSELKRIKSREAARRRRKQQRQRTN